MRSDLTNSAWALNNGYWPNDIDSFDALSDPVYTTMGLTPSDPLYPTQSHFAFLGDIETIWEEYSGAGVHVGVYDDGLQYSHPDLAANYDATLHVKVTDDNGNLVVVDPLLSANVGHPHGTSVAGLIAAANNGVGVVGLAWGAKLTGVNIFSDLADINNRFEGFLEATAQIGQFDVVNHSWGKYPLFFQDPETLARDQQVLEQWFDALDTGRDGLGTIQVKAAGNDNLNANGDSLDNTRATIIVGAYDDSGDASYYSNYGANLLVSAFSSGFQSFFGGEGEGNGEQVTTDLIGSAGYNQGDYTDRDNGFGGTSGATPIVTGVVALMMEANESLGWRDVQNILAYSAHEVGSGVGGAATADENGKWIYNNADNWNGGGLHYSIDYGYGAVDAYNAVRLAEVWSLFGAPKTSANESSYTQSFTSDPDAGDGIELRDAQITEIKFTFGGADAFLVDFVNVSLNFTHERLLDLTIELVSPDGTVIDLINILDDSNELIRGEWSGWDSWSANFGVTALRGENGIGEWTIRISDPWDRDAGILNSASITLHGSDGAALSNLNDDVYHYTNEVFTTLSRDTSRINVADGDGGNDWLNMAAMSSNLVVKLSNGTTSTAGGVAFVTLGANANIENAVTGDGNDRISGNALANRLYGMRGNDFIEGGDGDDLLSGGAGNDTLIGGTDRDTFLFDRALNALANVDLIVDFSHIDDTIWLDATIFAGLALGTLDANLFFVIGSDGFNEFDRILYNGTSGALFFDADGSGDGAAIQFATLLGAPTDLSFDDFEIVKSENAPIVSTPDRSEPSTPASVGYEDPDEVLGLGGVTVGTEGADDIVTKNADDIIYGLGGDDVILAGGGNDTVYGGSGVDYIDGGDGNDTLWGGGTGDPVLGDSLYGGNGNDILHGSDQLDNEAWYQFINVGDSLAGGAGADYLYGYGGDDVLDGGTGDDWLYGGSGGDTLRGGTGNDRLYGGTGFRNHEQGLLYGNLLDGGSGTDTGVFEKTFADYFITGAGQTEMQLTRLNPLPGEEEVTRVRSTVERLEFSDGSTFLFSDLMYILANFGAPTAVSQTYTDANNDLEVAVSVRGAIQSVLVNDDRSVDKISYVQVAGVTGDVIVNSDALTALDISGQAHAITINAAEGERQLKIAGINLVTDVTTRIVDNTATSIIYSHETAGGLTQLGGGGVNGYALSFADVESFKFRLAGTTDIRWYVPSLTTIDVQRTVEERGVITDYGNYGTITFLTPLDDAILATAGGSADFKFIADAAGSSPISVVGREFVRFGNLGSKDEFGNADPDGADLSNDGTTGPDAFTNAGLGLRGTINLGDGADEAWILGTGAFQGGSIDAGSGLADYNIDVLRMTFGVASKIADISAHISNFEVLRLDQTSIGGQTVDVAKFDNLQTVAVTGLAGTHTQEHTIKGLLDGGTLIMQADATLDDFGTVHVVGPDGGTINLKFVSQGDGDLDTGTAHVAGATTVNINTDVIPTTIVDAFSQVVDLDDATTVNVTGEVGWDFTRAGTDIGKVTTIDASTITRVNAQSSVKATAQTTEDVSFTGGGGNDVFIGNIGNDTLSGNAGNDTLTGGDGNDTLTGGLGNDTLDGGAGIDRAVFSGARSAYTVTDNGDGSYSVAHTGTDGTDTLRGIEQLSFADGLYSLSGELLEAPSDILPDDASVAENAADGTVVAALTTVDANVSDTFTYKLLDNAGGRFAIVGSNLVVADGSGLDYEAATEHTVIVQVTDSSGLTFEQSVLIAVTDVAEEPTDIDPDAASVAENAPNGTEVADLSASDPDTGDTFTFALLDDAGGRFAISGNKLVVANSAGLDYETATSHTVTVQVTDSAGLSFDQEITISVTDVNEMPRGILPESASVAENSASGTEVATLSAIDPDTGDTFTYTLANNAGGRFAISGNKLVVADGSKLDYEASATHQVVVRATDAGGLWVEKTMTVSVTDVDENAAASVALINRVASIAENASTASRTKVADIVVTDDGRGTNALSLVGRDRALFEIVGMALYLKAGAALDASKLASLEVAVAVDDAAIPGTPDATSATYKLAVADVAGLNMVHGTSASQTLTGSSGSDWFDGHGGDDTFKGGRGDDIYLVDSSGDTVVEGKNEGTDTVRASVTHTLAANVENLVLTGSSSIHGSGNGLDNVIIGNSGNNKIWGYDGNDLLRGGDGNDGIDGGNGNDRLYGEAGNDTLKGGSGNDHIDGGYGTDALWGGSGKDVFDFDLTSDSVVGAGRDIIYDFERGKDHIDLASIDANTGRSGDQAFTWLGTKAFTGKAGELHFLDKGAEVIVQGDVNGDKIADFDILVKVGSLSHSDFVL